MTSDLFSYLPRNQFGTTRTGSLWKPTPPLQVVATRENANAKAGIKPQQESPRVTKNPRPDTNGKCTVTGTDMMVA